MVEQFIQHVTEGLQSVQASGSIFFWPYLLGSYVLTVTALVCRKKIQLRGVLKELFPKAIWASRSARTDVFVTTFYMMFFNVPTAALQIWIAGKTYSLVKDTIFSGKVFVFAQFWPSYAEAILVGVVTITAFDLATYVGHRLMHRVPFLWDIHVVHHSPQKLNLFSAYRQNPLDRVIRNSLGAVFTGSSLALLHFVFPSQTQAFTIMGVGAAFFMFLLTVHLQHSHIPVHYPKWLGAILLSPHLHQIHHSSDRRHFDKNFGGIFPWWDQMFGTLHDERLGGESLEFGLGESDPIKHSVVRCYTHPFQNWARRLVETRKHNRLANARQLSGTAQRSRPTEP